VECEESEPVHNTDANYQPSPTAVQPVQFVPKRPAVLAPMN